jgi:hypothetical protein
VILQKTIEGMDLREPGSSPFHLVARVHYMLGADAYDGIYELVWAAPDRWRENFTMDNVGSEEDLAFGDRLHVLRNTATFSLPLWRIRDTLFHSVQAFYGPDPKARHVYSSSSTGKSLNCIDSKMGGTNGRVCYDPQTSQAELLYLGWKTPDDSFELQLSDFVTLGKKRYPRRISRRQEDEAFELNVETLQLAAHFADAIFVPPRASITFPWCANPIEKGHVVDPLPPVFQIDAPPALLAYYVLVGTDGRIKTLRPIRSAGGNMDQMMAEWSHKAKFSIRMCRGEPIEYETALFVQLMRQISSPN